MWRSAWLAILGIAALIGLTACGSFAATETGASAPGTSHGSSITLSLRTVPTIRSITVSPGKSRFRNCSGGKPGDNTRSTPGALGCFSDHLRAEILGGILQVDFFGDGDAVIADQWFTKALFDQDALGFRPKGHAHSVGQSRCAAQDLFSRFGTK